MRAPPLPNNSGVNGKKKEEIVLPNNSAVNNKNKEEAQKIDYKRSNSTNKKSTNLPRINQNKSI